MFVAGGVCDGLCDCGGDTLLGLEAWCFGIRCYSTQEPLLICCFAGTLWISLKLVLWLPSRINGS